MHLELEAHAKINLTLEVLNRRQDGYHQVETVMQELELSDTLYLEDLPEGGVELETDHSGLPLDHNNLAFQAAQLVRLKYAPARGVHIRLWKRIPVAAGLGGGSSNAAAVLRGLNRLWGLSLEKDVLMGLGASLGSDVPFFLYGGTALAKGRGEIIRPLGNFPRTGVLLASPRNMELSTGLVYNALDLDKIPGSRNTEKLVQLLQVTGDCGQESPFFPELSSYFVNHLEEAVFSLEGQVKILKEKLLAKGLYALVSGSGPTVFAFSGQEEKLYEAAEELLAEGYRVVLTETKK